MGKRKLKGLKEVCDIITEFDKRTKRVGVSINNKVVSLLKVKFN